MKDLIDFVKNNNLMEGFESSIDLPSSYEGSSIYDKFPTDDIPNFVELLPEEIKDKQGNKIMISQSFIKRILKVLDGELCPKRVWATKAVKGIEEESSKVSQMGNRFQWLAFGLKDYHGNEPGQLLTEKTGVPSTDEKRIRHNADLAQETLKRLGYDINAKHTKMTIKCVDGELDLDTMKDGKLFYISDIKYSGMIGSGFKESEFNWPDEAMYFRQSAKIQATHYMLLAELNDMDRDGFSFLVFNSKAGKEGDYREYVVSVSSERINQHKHLVLHIVDTVQDYIENDLFIESPSYEKCKKCPLMNTCKKYQKYPETIYIEL